jgi:hypothetical protein
MKLLVALVTLLFASPASANIFGDESKNAARIADLLKKRDEKMAQANSLKSDSAKMKSHAEETVKAEKKIQELEKTLASGETISVTDRAKKESELEDLKSGIGTETSAVLLDKTAALDKSVAQLEAEVVSILGQLTGELSGKQNFKQSTSGYYAILIGLVIVGFFVIAFTDETVRRNIFSGEVGIQFVTLFSLVIAIILFGVCGILQDKELSALLGGLSGYILGRSGGSAPAPAPSSTGTSGKGSAVSD